MTATITARDVGVTLGDHVVLDGLSIDIASGDWLNVIGPNGAGKTTLLRAILGGVAFTGKIEIDGVDTSSHDPMRRARAIAYVPQVPLIPPGMTVIDYLLLGRTPHRGVFSGDSRHDREVVRRVLDRLDLAGFKRRAVRSLSGGERQRVVLGRALVQESSILLLDEPTTALDLGHQQDVLDLVEELRRESGLTVVATLHDLTLAARYGDRIAVLSQGIIAESGPPAQVLTEDLIRHHFGANVRVLDDGDGPVIVPVAAKRQPPDTKSSAPRGSSTASSRASSQPSGS